MIKVLKNVKCNCSAMEINNLVTTNYLIEMINAKVAQGQSGGRWLSSVVRWNA